MLAVWFVVRISLALGTTLNNQQAVLAPGIVRLVPLGFLPSDKTGFVGPIPWIWRAVFVKLISPDQFPALRLRRTLAGLLACRACLSQDHFGSHRAQSRHHKQPIEFHGLRYFFMTQTRVT